MHPQALEAKDPVLFHELPAIRRIIQDETWLEGERRGCSVSPYDAVVRENVCRVVLQVGQQLRESIVRRLPVAERTASTEGRISDEIDFEI